MRVTFLAYLRAANKRRLVLRPASLMPIVLMLLIAGNQLLAAAPPAEGTQYPIELGKWTVDAEIAATPAVRAHGLMFRRAMAEDAGMLFVFDRPRPLSFWMRNTSIPLDIGFFDANGVLLEIHALYPLDERGVSSTHGDLLYALEMNQGWFERHDVKPGDRLSRRSLDDALAAFRRDQAESAYSTPSN